MEFNKLKELKKIYEKSSSQGRHFFGELTNDLEERIRKMLNWLKNDIEKRAGRLAFIISIMSLLLAALREGSFQESTIIDYMIFLATLFGGLATAGGVCVALFAMNKWKEREDWIKKTEIAESLIRASIDIEVPLSFVTSRLSNKDFKKDNISNLEDDLSKIINNFKQLRITSRIAKRYFPNDARMITTEIFHIKKYNYELYNDIGNIINSTNSEREDIIKNIQKKYKNKSVTGLFENLNKICFKYVKPAKNI